MDKLNTELIRDRDEIYDIEEQIKSLEKRKNVLKDKVHLYIDSSKHNTEVLEQYIMNDCWTKAYKRPREDYFRKVYKKYMKYFLPKTIDIYVKNANKAIALGCGDGVITKIIAKKFKQTMGADLSQNAIDLANKINKANNITYTCNNAKEVVKQYGNFDFVFASDILMYASPSTLHNIFDEVSALLNKGGVLLLRESVQRYGYKNNLSRGYTAYYRDKDFYTKLSNISHKKNLKFTEKFEGHEYFLYHTNKIFSVFPNSKKEILKNPKRLQYYNTNFKSKDATCRYYYVFEKKDNT